MNSCFACRAVAVEQLADFGPQAIGHHFYDGTQAEETHPLRFGVCQECALAQLIEPVRAPQLIPRVDWLTYNEPEQHLDAVAAMLLSLPGITSESIIAGVSYKEDSMLRRFRNFGHRRTWRCEPKGDLGIEDPRAGVETILTRIRPELADTLKAKHGAPDLVIVRHIFEHTQDTPAFLETFRRLVAPGGYVVFEVPECVRGFEVLDFTTLWEDHTLYFVESTFLATIERAGFRVVRFERYKAAYENCLVAVVQPAPVKPVLLPPTVKEAEIARARAFAAGFPGYCTAIRRELESWRSRGRIVIFGAGHQSATFLNLTNTADLIAGVIDDNPRKRGQRMPGSRVPIVGSRILSEPDVKLCLFSLSAESEMTIMQKQDEFLAHGGTFASIYSVSPGALLNFVGRLSAKPLELPGLRRVNDEVFVAQTPVVRLGGAELLQLKHQAGLNPRQRVRVCAHKSSTDRLHEMLIVLTNRVYIRPHKHLNKSESFHVIEGSAAVVFFDEVGKIDEVIRVGPASSGAAFYFRNDDTRYHTQIITSPELVFHETTNGPFNRADTVYAPWAPEENDALASLAYRETLAREISTR